MPYVGHNASNIKNCFPLSNFFQRFVVLCTTYLIAYYDERTQQKHFSNYN